MNEIASTDQPRYINVCNDAGEHIITKDTKTGKEWQARHFGPLDQDATDAAIAALNAEAFGGYTDWRLADVDEQQTILDRTRFDPAIDTDHFPDCPSGYFRSSTVTPWNAEARFVVDFDLGLVSYLHRGLRAFARALRESSQ